VCITPFRVGVVKESAAGLVSAGTGGAGEGLLGAGSSGVAGSGVGPGLEDQDDGLVQRAAPRVVFAVRVAELAAVFAAGGAELAEGDRVGAGFGEAVPAVAEGVRPLTQPRVPGRLVGAEVPRRWSSSAGSAGGSAGR